jgi:hypothetical protein
MADMGTPCGKMSPVIVERPGPFKAGLDTHLTQGGSEVWYNYRKILNMDYQRNYDEFPSAFDIPYSTF